MITSQYKATREQSDVIHRQEKSFQLCKTVIWEKTEIILEFIFEILRTFLLTRMQGKKSTKTGVKHQHT